MNLDKVEYKNGRAYVSRIRKSGNSKGIIKREFGQIIICQHCKEKAFAINGNIKNGDGRYCSNKCKNSDVDNNNWKGGIRKHEAGYIESRATKHPFARSGYVFEHRLIVERQIGRYLHRWETVHHINKIKADNRPNNLMAFKNDKSHKRFEKGLNIDKENIIFDGSRHG